MSMTDPKQLERRLMLDTYSIFGCDDGEPTYRYTLLDGVKDGFLINPTVVDVETGLSADIMSKEGLTFRGVDKDGKDVLAGVYYKTLISPLIKVVQEQKKEIDTLKTKVAALGG